MAVASVPTDVTTKRHAKGLVLKLRKQVDMTHKRHAKGIVLKLKKQADVTSKRHVKGLYSNQGSNQT